MPFTTEQFLGVFEKYNLTIWPMQVILFLLAISAVALSIWRTKASGKAISLILTFLWLWIGIVYHIIFFTSINKAAYLFGIFNIVQAALFLYAGVIKSKITFGNKIDLRWILGAIIIAYGLVIYPILGYLAGHTYPHNPTFGLPCPTTIFTFGLLLWSDKAPKYLFIIPALWALLGFSAVFNFGIIEDAGLLISAIISVIAIFIQRKKAEFYSA